MVRWAVSRVRGLGGQAKKDRGARDDAQVRARVARSVLRRPPSLRRPCAMVTGVWSKQIQEASQKPGGREPSHLGLSVAMVTLTFAVAVPSYFALINRHYLIRIAESYFDLPYKRRGWRYMPGYGQRRGAYQSKADPFHHSAHEWYEARTGVHASISSGQRSKRTHARRVPPTSTVRIRLAEIMGNSSSSSSSSVVDVQQVHRQVLGVSRKRARPRSRPLIIAKPRRIIRTRTKPTRRRRPSLRVSRRRIWRSRGSAM